MKRSPRYLIALALGLGLALVLMWLLGGNLPAAHAASPARPLADTIIVTTTIQAAVDAAANGDTIGIPAGTYTENVNITGKVLTFIGAGMGSTIVDGGGAGRVFSSTSDIALASLTLQNGNITDNSGGGLYTAGSVTLTNVAVLSNTAAAVGGGAYAGGAATLSGGLFQNNSADYGGGLYVDSTLSLTGTQFLSNTATGHGGGAYAGGAARLSGGLFQNNACTGSSCFGGGLYTYSTLTLTGTQFLSNTAHVGGGAVAWGAATLYGGLFQANRSQGTVGGAGGLFAYTTLMMTGTQFVRNMAPGPDSGGGASHWTGNGRLVNVLFVGNTAGGNGSAIDLGSPDQVELVHTTIASPTVGAGTAIYVRQGTANITNTLVASYTTSIQQAGGTVNSDYNLFYDAPTTVTIGSHSLTGINPLFVNPASDNYRLAVGSPAAGAGINVGVATDLDGVTRPDPPAIGAYEVSLCFATVDGVTIYSSADASAVQQAVDAATAGDTVKIAGTCAGVQARGGTTQTVHISQALTLAGGYTTTNWTTPYPITQPTTLDAKSRGRVVLATVDITLSDLTIQNGSAATGQGGGLYTAGSVTLTNLSVLSNTASSGGGAYAIGAATLTGGLFQNNHAGYGGGLRTNGTLTLTGTQFLSDTATQDGGGVWAGGAATLSGGLFQNNRAGWGGGLFASSTFTLTGTQFLSNTATYWGGGAYVWGAATLLDSVFQNNHASYGGGLYQHASGDGRLVNTLFVGNAASDNGSALYLGSPGQVTLVHTTIASRTVGAGAAIYVYSGTVNITNTLVASYTTSIQQTGGTVNLDYNLFFNAPTTVTIGNHSLTGTNPLFVNPAGEDYRLAVGSPAAGKGLNLSVATDLDGNPRHDPPTIGAYEGSSFVITPTAGVGGVITPGTPQAVDYGGSATFTLTADTGYHIVDVGVDGASVGVTTTYTFNNVTADHTITATFDLLPPVYYTLTVNQAGTGSGTVTKSPDSISYTAGTIVTLTASANAGSTFVGWGGACYGPGTVLLPSGQCVVPMTANLLVTATFDLLPPAYYTLTVNTIGQGEVTRAPSQTTYLSGTVVTLTAVPAAGWYLEQWSGDASGTLTQTTVTMNANKAVTATFAQSSSCTPVSGPSLIYAPQSPLVGQTVTFTGTVSAGTTPITYTWAWGDGTPGGVGATLSHTFPLTVTAQSYTVTLSVSNACSGPVAAMQVVAVTPRRIFLPLVLR